MTTDFVGAAQFGGDAVLSFWKIGLLMEMVTGPLTAVTLGLLPAAGQGLQQDVYLQKITERAPSACSFCFSLLQFGEAYVFKDK